MKSDVNKQTNQQAIKKAKSKNQQQNIHMQSKMGNECNITTSVTQNIIKKKELRRCLPKQNQMQVTKAVCLKNKKTTTKKRLNAIVYYKMKNRVLTRN